MAEQGPRKGLHSPMIYIGVDPGLTNGVAMVSVELGWTHGRQIEGREALVSYLHLVLAGLPDNERVLVIVEDYVGSGQRDAPSKETILTIGAVDAVCQLSNVQVIKRAPQVRRAFVKQARELLEASHSQRHAADALAHILSWRYARERKTSNG